MYDYFVIKDYQIELPVVMQQQTVDKIFSGLPGVLCFPAYILIAGKGEIPDQEKPAVVLKHREDDGMKTHKDKCQFLVPSIGYLME